MSIKRILGSAAFHTAKTTWLPRQVGRRKGPGDVEAQPRSRQTEVVPLPTPAAPPLPPHNASRDFLPESMSKEAQDAALDRRDKRVKDQSRLGKAVLPNELIQAVEQSISVCDKDLLRQDALDLYTKLRQSTDAVALPLRRRPTEKALYESDIDDDDDIEDGMTRGQAILQERREARQAVKAAEKQARRVASLNERRAHKGTKAGGPILTRRDVLAHVAAEMPGHYAAISSVFGAILARQNEWIPKDALEYGTRAGAGLWALRSTFGDESIGYTGIDASEAMLRGAEALTSGNVSFFKDRRMATEDILQVSATEEPAKSPVQPTFLRLSPDLLFTPTTRPDLVMSNFFLSTLSNSHVRERALRRMWANTGDMFIIVERGTPRGFELIEEARRFVLGLSDNLNGIAESHIVAPCPHTFECPMRNLSKDFCHFSQRLQTPAYLRKTRHSKSGDEDIKYSYVVIRRGPQPVQKAVPESTWGRLYPEARVMTPPLKRSGHVLIDLCVPNGQLERHTMTRSQGKDIYAQARKSRWGDRMDWAGKRIEIRSRGLQRLEKVQKAESGVPSALLAM